ncbi:glycosyltransferase [Altererythrobacter salegens]|uniref:Glycosyltransferase n=1 Tax=Croceibacterium salegens TaxID=1737568 RepID=A0A6I4SZR5_9SPHN|nr:glycosyltransferase [Croceibacterium salegens]MXO60720.1 glycosyltransferase [Croceibacterium salegens]
MLRKVEAERLHSHFANSGATVGMLAAGCLRIPWSLTLHGISETDAPAGMLLPAKLERADFVACASWFMRAQAMRVSSPEIWPKFRIVRCGVEMAKMPESLAPTFEGGIKFVTVGRLSSEKGQLGLIEAFGQLVVDGVDASLTVVGDGPLRQALAQALLKFNLADRVHMRGALSETDTLLEIAAADIFVLPSLMEGLPVVLMEAMAMRKPVIAPSLAGIPELVENGVTGFMFRPGDWVQMSERMRLLAGSRGLCHEISARGYERIQEEFEISNAVRPLTLMLSN